MHACILQPDPGAALFVKGMMKQKIGNGQKRNP